MHYFVLIPEHSKTFTVKSGSSLLSIMQHHHVDLAAPCGGKGTCQKCQVQIDQLGTVLACQLILDETLWQRLGLSPEDPLVVHVPERRHQALESDDIHPDARLNPLVCRGRTQVPSASLSNQHSDQTRFETASGCTVPFERLAELSHRLAMDPPEIFFDFRTDTRTVVRFVEDAKSPLLGCAIDVGTTTLAGYLFDLETGDRLAQLSQLNPQKSFGADVISRIEYAAESAENLNRIHAVIQSGLSELIASLLDAANTAQSGSSYEIGDLLVVTLAGNTTMMHLLCGLDPVRIGKAPFIPVTVSSRILQTSQIGLRINSDALAVLLPSVSGYVGADITAGILACDLKRTVRDAQKKHNSPRFRILLDIGTNGEIVLAGPDGLVACATAAGPAFEGANIACGMPAMTGALDQAHFDGHSISLSIIGKEMRGICGSGLVALVASLLDAGVIDETGRIQDPDELSPSVSQKLRQSIGQINNQPVFYLNERVYISQKDIRELQNAKAAIAAGLAILLDESGAQPDDEIEIDLAGGFGNYLNVDHAIRIGLVPERLRGSVRTAGNTSGLGASLCLLDDSMRLETETVASQVRYTELSGHPKFSDLYIDAMVFPDPRVSQPAQPAFPMNEITDLLQLALEQGATYATWLPITAVPFEPVLRTYCDQNACGRFATCWAGPPAIGEVGDLMDQVRTFAYGIVVQTVDQLEDSFDIEGMTAARERHVAIFRQCLAAIKSSYPGRRLLPLDAGCCDICPTCTYPDAPCRYPDEAMPSVESYGIDVYRLLKACGLQYNNGKDTVSYVGLIALDLAQ